MVIMNNKSIKSFVCAVLCIGLILTGCSAREPISEEDAGQHIKNEKEEKVISYESNASIKRHEIEAGYYGAEYTDGYVLLGNGHTVVDTEGNEILDSPLLNYEFVRGKDETYFKVDYISNEVLYDNEKKEVLNDKYAFINSTGDGFFCYNDGKSLYVDKDNNVKEQFDGVYNLIWNDKYLVKGGQYNIGDTYDYIDKEYQMPRIYDCSSSSYTAPNDFGEVYDLDENLLLRLDSSNVPHTTANYYLVGENMILEAPGSENMESDNPSMVRLLDFDLNEIAVIAGIGDTVSGNYYQNGVVQLQLKYFSDRTQLNEKIKKSRKGTLAEGLEKGLYYFDLKSQKILNDEPYPLVEDSDVEENDDTYQIINGNNISITNEPVTTYLYLGYGVYAVENEDGEVAIVDYLGNELEDYSYDLKIDAEDFYYEDHLVDMDRINGLLCLPNNNENLAYFMFSVREDQYNAGIAEGFSYTTILYTYE